MTCSMGLQLHTAVIPPISSPAKAEAVELLEPGFWLQSHPRHDDYIL